MIFTGLIDGHVKPIVCPFWEMKFHGVICIDTLSIYCIFLSIGSPFGTIHTKKQEEKSVELTRQLPIFSNDGRLIAFVRDNLIPFRYNSAHWDRARTFPNAFRWFHFQFFSSLYTFKNYNSKWLHLFTTEFDELLSIYIFF